MPSYANDTDVCMDLKARLDYPHDIIYDFVQVNILSSNSQNPVINAKYQQICDNVRNRRMGLTKDYFKQEEIKRLKNKLKELEE